MESSVERLSRPLYNYADSDYLAGVSRGTSKRWIDGYQYLDSYGSHIARPPVTIRPQGADGVSFLDLVEIVAIGGLKDLGFSLKRIREIVANCQEILQVSRPLTTVQFKTDGREIFVNRNGALVEVGKRKGEQAWYDVLEPFLKRLDYTNGTASRWWPLGIDGPIMLDPDYAFGFPVIRNSGVRTEIVLERFRAGDLEDTIADDFNVERVEVERALQFELQRAA